MDTRFFKAGQPAYVIKEAAGLLDAKSLEEVQVKYVGKECVKIGRNKRFSITDCQTPYLIDDSAYTQKQFLFPTERAATDYLALDSLRQKVHWELSNGRVEQLTLGQLKEVVAILQNGG